MSVPRDGVHPVPVATARVAPATFPDGLVSVRRREERGTLVDDEVVTAVSGREGHPALHPWHRALVSGMPVRAHLSDRQPAPAVCARIDWKFARGLEVSDAGLHSSVRERVSNATGARQDRTGPGGGYRAQAVPSTGLAQSARAGGAPTQRRCWDPSQR
jgi:hypothetical protein